jgi:hypothetical protein
MHKIQFDLKIGSERMKSIVSLRNLLIPLAALYFIEFYPKIIRFQWFK